SAPGARRADKVVGEPLGRRGQYLSVGGGGECTDAEHRGAGGHGGGDSDRREREERAPSAAAGPGGWARHDAPVPVRGQRGGLARQLPVGRPCRQRRQHLRQRLHLGRRARGELRPRKQIGQGRLTRHGLAPAVSRPRVVWHVTVWSVASGHSVTPAWARVPASRRTPRGAPPLPPGRLPPSGPAGSVSSAATTPSLITSARLVGGPASSATAARVLIPAMARSAAPGVVGAGPDGTSSRGPAGRRERRLAWSMARR